MRSDLEDELNGEDHIDDNVCVIQKVEHGRVLANKVVGNGEGSGRNQNADEYRILEDSAPNHSEPRARERGKSREREWHSTARAHELTQYAPGTRGIKIRVTERNIRVTAAY